MFYGAVLALVADTVGAVDTTLTWVNFTAVPS